MAIKKIKKQNASNDAGKSGTRKIVLGWIVFLEVVAIGLAVAMMYARRPAQELADNNSPREFIIRFINCPDWMPDSLVDLLGDDMTPSNADFRSPELTMQIYDLATTSPLVSQVKGVRKISGTDPSLGVVEVEAVFRRPIAIVHQDIGDRYIDAEGFVIPEEMVPKFASITIAADGSRTASYYLGEDEIPPGATYNRMHYIRITGVDSLPPLPGQQWVSPELPDAIRLVEMVSGRVWAPQIAIVDMRNFKGRISTCEPDIRMYATDAQRKLMDIRFGRFPMTSVADYVIAPERKLMYLDSYAADHGGKLAGFNSYLDLRYDQLHVSIN